MPIKPRLWILTILSIALINVVLQAQGSQNVLVLDDFEDFIFNNLEEETAVFQDTIGSNITKTALRNLGAFCNSGKSLNLNYNLAPVDSSFCGMVSILPLTDLSNYNYLSFWIRNLGGKDMVQIELERNNGEKTKLFLWDYLKGGPSKEWQKVVIPLDDFWNLSERTNIKQLVVVMEGIHSMDNNANLNGTIQIDDMLFGSYFLGYVKIDPFNNINTVNATGGNSGNFPNLENYNSSLICDDFDADGDCQLNLYFDNDNEQEFGGYFSILGGQSTGWDPAIQPLDNYDLLYLEARAINDFTNPGNFKVELKQSPDNSMSTRINGVSTEENSFSVNLDDFDRVGNPTGLSEFVVVFEKNQQEVLEGNLILDNIELRAAGYTFPDPSYPDAPTLVSMNGSAFGNNNPLQSGMNTINVTASGNDPKLELVRLEYLEGCIWHCLDTKYAPLGSNITFEFEANDFLKDSELKIRVVAQNYNGAYSTSTEENIQTLSTNTDYADLLFRSSFDAFQSLRAETGVYKDAAVFEGEQFHPASVATTGMGLISLCIGDAMGWIDNAEELILETLQSINGQRPGFTPERNCAGWFRHFIDFVTGTRPEDWDSEFSSIDSGILAAGGLFCKSYFSDNEMIAVLADELYLSIDWSTMIAEVETGAIYREADEFGEASGITLPYNEYMIVAWLAKNDFRNDSIANQLWDMHYANTNNLHKSVYDNDGELIEVLTDFPGNFLPNFIPQFNYYLCHPFSQGEDYQESFNNALRVDSLWWRANTDTYCTIWGFGAGSSCDWVASGYHADNIIEHPGLLCSPHIIAGFIPVDASLIEHVIHLYKRGVGVYEMPEVNNTEVLWRFSLENPGWRACDIQGIDFSTFLFGLASHPDFLGTSFFETNNDFDFPSPEVYEMIGFGGIPDTLQFTYCETPLPGYNYLLEDQITPASLINWSLIQENDNFSIAISDSPCEFILQVDSIFVGSEQITLIATDPLGQSDSSMILVEVLDSCLTIAVEELNPLNFFDLKQNQPNPFTLQTRIPFRLYKSDEIVLSIFNIMGELILREDLGVLPQGEHNYLLEKEMSEGIYIYQISNGFYTASKKMIVAGN
jgi:hypothetical protein